MPGARARVSSRWIVSLSPFPLDLRGSKESQALELDYEFSRQLEPGRSQPALVAVSLLLPGWGRKKAVAVSLLSNLLSKLNPGGTG